MVNLNNSIKFLGICEKFQEIKRLEVQNGFQITGKDLIGLSEFVLSYIFPASVPYWVVGIDVEVIKGEKQLNYSLILKNEKFEKCGDGFIGVSLEGPVDIPGNLVLFAIPSDKVFLESPGRYYLYSSYNGEEKLIGSFFALHIPAAALTESQIEAIKTDPFARKFVKFELNYKSEVIKTYAGVGKKKNDSTMKDYIWYQDLPDYHTFSDGKQMNLQYIKNNLHAFLGSGSISIANISFENIYSKSSLVKLHDEFKALIEKNLSEEKYQEFIENNPVILSFLSPKSLAYKSPIGSKYKTDFTLVNNRNQLTLIELQLPSLELFTKSGQISSSLQKESDQVLNWFDEVEKDRYGKIRDLNINVNVDSIADIRGIVICGRRKSSDTAFHHKLNRYKNIDFYTYDDLLSQLLITAEKLFAMK